jgi:hypothetical protein
MSDSGLERSPRREPCRAQQPIDLCPVTIPVTMVVSSRMGCSYECGRSALTLIVVAAPVAIAVIATGCEWAPAGARILLEQLGWERPAPLGRGGSG